MTNDLTTLSGALLEMKDQLIYELGQKGVTATYDSTTGLLGLIGRISDIQTGGSCYHIEFSESSYTASGGQATLEILLQQNYAPLSGATVTVTGSDSSLYTGITNSQGLAEINVSSITGTVTFTASYSNVTDTCTVTSVSYLFYDACDSSAGLSNYGSSVVLRGTNASATISYNSSENAYEISGTGNYFAGIPITPLNGEDNFKITAEMKCSQNSGDCQIGFYTRDSSDTSKQAYSTHLLGDARYRWFYVTPSTNGSYSAINTSTNHYQTYHKMEWGVEGTSIKMNIYDSNDTVAYTITKDRDNYTSKEYGLWVDTERGTNYKVYVKNIKAEYL